MQTGLGMILEAMTTEGSWPQLAPANRGFSKSSTRQARPSVPKEGFTVRAQCLHSKQLLLAARAR